MSVKPFWNGFQFLFIFVFGFIADIFLHILARIGVIAPKLVSYYDSLDYFPPHIKSKNGKLIKITVWGGIWAGISVVFALVGANVLLEFNELASNQSDNEETN